jgi:5-methylcytosine-specific restriction endonuclease McrA
MHRKWHKRIGRITKVTSKASHVVGASKGSRACIYQTQPPTNGKPKVDGATFRITPKNTLRDGLPSPGPCNQRINQALGKASGARKASVSQADSEPRRGKHHPAQTGEQAGNRFRALVLGHHHQASMPCSSARARQLLKAGKAAIFRRDPFTIILKGDEPLKLQPICIKIDPGSQITGIAITAATKRGEKVVWAMELHHRGQDIRDALLQRSQLRRGRRFRKTRYRPARFNNRSKPDGWLPPSLRHRVDRTLSWVRRLQRCLPITHISLENVQFDTQLMENPDIAGVEYQNGTLAGWEVREYLLLKHDYQCAYCGQTADYYEVDHLTPRTRGGSNRLTNLVLSCEPCNQDKGARTCEEYGYPYLRGVAAQPLKDAAAVNTTRWALWNGLKALDLPLESGTGGMTKKNRHDQGYPKQHWIDAACVGVTGSSIRLNPANEALQVTSQARHSRRMCLPDKYGFPRGKAKGPSRWHGFTTGDVVTALIPGGKRKGKHIGRVSIRITGIFRIGKADGISFRHCKLLQRNDGYSYSTPTRASSPAMRAGASGASHS